MNRLFPGIMSVALASLLFPCAALFAQSPGAAKSPSGATNQMVKRGQTLFYDHCPICHFGRTGQPGSGRYTGPNLKGILKGAEPAKEAEIRKAILEGTPNMPGYKYTFKPAQIQDLIAFLKTYN